MWTYRGKKEEVGQPKMERCMSERCDRGGHERGQHDKQGRMEEEANQLYRRHQMTGQTREEEEYMILSLYQG